MATNHFMAADIRAILFSFSLFSLVAFVPGYALGMLFDVMRFRSRSLGLQIALSTALSISLGPILTYFVGRWLSLNAACVVYLVLAGYAGIVVTVEFARKRTPGRWRPYLRPLALVSLWIAIAVLSLADLQIDRRLYFSVIGYDYFARTSFTAAISHFGIPPPNPFYFPGHPVVLRYHYFWLAQAALVHRLASSLLDARQAFAGTTLWAGIGLICIVVLYLRFFSPLRTFELSRRATVGVCLLAVTGLDILPTLLLLGFERVGLLNAVSPSVEWWNNQIDGWLYTMLWEPHYVAGLIACLTGFLLIWTVPRSASRKECTVTCCAAGMAFASAVGAALYVALVFAGFLLCWLIISLHKRWRREALLLAAAGTVGLLLAGPFLLALREPGSGGAVISPTVRAFSFGEVLLTSLGLTQKWELVLGNALFLPLNYFLELGFFLAAGRIAWARFRLEKRELSRYELASVSMICVSAGICTFLTSGVVQNNDLGWRGFLPAQFALLIVAADLWANRAAAPRVPGTTQVRLRGLAPPQTSLLLGLLILGAAGTVYDLGILRFYPVLSDQGVVPKIPWLSQDANLGARTYANRQAYEWLRARSSPASIIQQNPEPVLQDTFYGLYSNRRTVAEEPGCGTVFGGDPRPCRTLVTVLAALFSGARSSGSDAFPSACETLSIDALVAKDTDAVWRDPRSWVWRRKPLFSNPYVRIFACRPNRGGAVLTYRGKNRD